MHRFSSPLGINLQKSRLNPQCCNCFIFYHKVLGKCQLHWPKVHFQHSPETTRGRRGPDLVKYHHLGLMLPGLLRTDETVQGKALLCQQPPASARARLPS